MACCPSTSRVGSGIRLTSGEVSGSSPVVQPRKSKATAANRRNARSEAIAHPEVDRVAQSGAFLENGLRRAFDGVVVADLDDGVGQIPAREGERAPSPHVSDLGVQGPVLQL